MNTLIQGSVGHRVMLASEKQVAKMQRRISRCSVLFFVICGAAYNCAQSAMVDAYDVLSKTKYWRHGVKKGVKQALSAYDRWDVHVKHQAGETYGLWLDTTDAVYDEMRPHIQTLFYTVDAELLRLNVDDHRLKAHMLTAMTVIEICCYMHDQAMDQFREQCGTPIRATFGRSDFNAVRQTWETACSELFRQTSDPEVCLNGNKEWELAVKVLRNKFDNHDMYNRAATYALEMNPDRDTRTEEEKEAAC